MSIPTDLISSDSHMTEPADRLWVEGMPKDMRDDAPRLYVESHGELAFGSPRMQSIGAAQFWAAGKAWDKESDALMTAPQSTARPGGWDPAERLKDMAADGLVAEVLYPSLGLALFWTKDVEFQRAAFRVYNDWLAEFISYDPKRYVGLGMISCYDIQQAVAELERIKKQGLGGAMIWTEAPEELTYQGRHHDPLFAAAQELDMPISLHVGTGYDCRHLAPGNPYYFRGAFARFELLRGLAQIIYTGTFDRFPRLRIVLCEYGVAWVPEFVTRADNAFAQYEHIDKVRPARKPSSYFDTNIWLTYVKDPELVPHVRTLGSTKHVMWSSDYPHQQSTWPKSREYIERETAGFSDEEIAQVTRDNVVSLYGLDLPYLNSHPLPAPAAVA